MPHLFWLMASLKIQCILVMNDNKQTKCSEAFVTVILTYETVLLNQGEQCTCVAFMTLSLHSVSNLPCCLKI